MPMFVQDSPRRLFWGTLLVRILVGWVFLAEGIQKFLFPAALGAGRFAKIGTRDLADLTEKGALVRTGERKHARYALNQARG